MFKHVLSTFSNSVSEIHSGLPAGSRDTLRLPEGFSLVSRQAESDQPNAKQIFKPSKEVVKKMRPIARESFHDLLRLASRPFGKPAQARKKK